MLRQLPGCHAQQDANSHHTSPMNRAPQGAAKGGGGPTIANCEMGPLFTVLGVAVAMAFFPGHETTTFIGWGGLDVPALVQFAKARKEHFRSLGR